MALTELPLARLGWGEMRQVSWTLLVERGFPLEVAELGRDLGRGSGRPITVFAMPMLEAGVSGLAVPFLHDDGILFDESLLDDAVKLAKIVAHEMAHILYPGWRDPSVEEFEEMEQFASALGPMLLGELPDDADKAGPIVDRALSEVLAA